METLDDSIKDNDTNKDVTDKATIPDEGLETVKVSAHIAFLFVFLSFVFHELNNFIHSNRTAF